VSSASRNTLLLVEDETLIAMSEKAALEEYGYRVIMAITGEQAVEIMGKTSGIDLVLMDINLGKGIDGIEAAQAIVRHRDIPVVFLSSHTSVDMVRKTEKTTSYGYVVKNSGITVLDASIKMAFKLFAANRELKTTNDKLEATIRAIPDLLFVVDKDGYFREFRDNTSSASFAMPKEKIIGSNLLDIFPPEEVATQLGLYRSCLETGELQTYDYQLDIQGSKKFFALRLTKLDDDHVLAIIRDITERKQAEDSLRKSEELFKSVVHNSSVLTVLTDEEGVVTYVSPQCEAILGHPESEFIGTTIPDIIHPEDMPKCRKTWEMVFLHDQELQDFEYRIIDGDGRIRWVSHSARMCRVKGRKIGIQNTIRDITESKKSEEALLESEEKYRRIIEQSHEGIVTTDGKGIIVTWNQSMETITGFSRSDTVGRPLWEIQSRFIPPERATPDTALIIKSIIETLIESKKTVAEESKEREIRCTDGTRKFIRDSYAVVQHGDKVSLEFVITDMTSQRQAVDVLEREKERLRNVLIGTKAGTWDWNIQTGEATIDEESAAILGYSSSELKVNRLETWMGLKHPDDREKANEELMKHIRGETEFYSFESRMRHRNGDWVWVHGRGKVIEWDSDQKPLRMFGTHVDISERKKVEEALRESELKYRSLIESSTDAIFSVDENGRYTFTNHLFASTFGQTPEYFIGKTFWDVYPKEHADYRFATTKRVFRTGTSESIEVEVPLPDRTLFFYATANPIKDETGKVVLVLTHAVDITERKLAEHRITSLLADKELLLKEVHHRIKNNIGTMMSLLSLQAGSAKDPTVIKALNDAENRLYSMGVLYDKLYRSDNFAEISVKEYLPALVEAIVKVFPNSGIVEIESRVDDFRLGINILSSLGIMVNEIITNSMKYAFTDRDKGVIEIAAIQQGNRVTVTIGDNGIGLPKSVAIETSDSFGMLLIETLTEQLRGAIRIERKKGTRYILEFDVGEGGL